MKIIICPVVTTVLRCPCQADDVHPNFVLLQVLFDVPN